MPGKNGFRVEMVRPSPNLGIALQDDVRIFVSLAETNMNFLLNPGNTANNPNPLTLTPDNLDITQTNNPDDVYKYPAPPRAAHATVFSHMLYVLKLCSFLLELSQLCLLLSNMHRPVVLARPSTGAGKGAMCSCPSSSLVNAL